MNKLNTLPSKIFLIVVFCICSCVLVHRALQPDMDPDLPWHITMGRQLLSNFEFPIKDASSIHHTGEAIFSPAWAFDFFTASIYETFGNQGIQVTKALIFLLSISILLLLPPMGVSNWATGLALVIVTYGLQRKFTFRPDTTVAPLVLLSLLMFYRLLSKFSYKSIGMFSLMLVLWTNWHTSATYGFIIAGALLMHYWWLLLKGKMAFSKVAFSSIALFLPSELGLQLPNPIFFLLAFPDYMREVNVEYQPLALVNLSSSAVTLMCTGLAAGVLAIFQKRIGVLVIVIIFLQGAFRAQRVLNVFYVVTSILVAWEFSVAFRSDFFQFLKKPIKILSYGLCAVLFLVPFNHIFDFANRAISSEYTPGYFPNEFGNQIALLPNGTRVFNDHNIGGYLTLFPHIKIWIDGRTNILYSEDDIKRYQENVVFPERFLKTVIDEKIDWVLAHHKQDANNIALMAVLTQKYTVKWLSQYFVGLSNSSPHLVSPTVLLYYPHCYKNFERRILERDLKGLSLVPEEPTQLIRETVNFLLSNEPTSTTAEILEQAEKYKRNATILRALSLRASDLKNYQLASAILNSIGQKIVWDHLMISQWYLDTGRADLANLNLTNVPELGFFSQNQLKEFARLHDESTRLSGGHTNFPEERLKAFRNMTLAPGLHSGVWHDPKCTEIIAALTALNH